ncbi:MAG: response regulator, partial [Myxococcales bacterium]
MGGQRRVLVVDDDPAHLYSIGRRLEAAGLAVLQAATGEQALALAPEADAVILDVHLPDMTGFEVCSRLRALPALVDLPIIHISAAYVADADLVQGFSSGADAYLTRPVDDDVVVHGAG